MSLRSRDRRLSRLQIPARRQVLKDKLAKNDVLLIVGKSPAVWDDVEAFWEFGVRHDVCCINCIGAVYPCDFDHWFSYHGVELAERFPDKRGALLHSVSRCTHPKIDYAWKIHDTGGSSAFIGGRCALMYWGYARVVFAGCGITNDGYWDNTSGEDSYRYRETFLATWQRFHPELKDRIRSMSGNTMEIYGYPTPGWLNGND